MSAVSELEDQCPLPNHKECIWKCTTNWSPSSSPFSL